MEYNLAVLLLACLTFLLAGLVKGVTGMGLPTVAMGILGSLLSPSTAAALLLLPSLITNIFQLGGGGHAIALMRRLWPMQVAIVIFTLFSSQWLATGHSAGTQLALGVALVVYALWMLTGRTFSVSARAERNLALPVGMVTGLLTGATGVFVMPAVPWLQALRLEKDELVQALGISFTSSTLALAAGLWWHGALHSTSLGVSGLAVIPALIGLFAGQRLRRVISAPVFKRYFLICLLGLGLEMTIRAL